MKNISWNYILKLWVLTVVISPILLMILNKEADLIIGIKYPYYLIYSAYRLFFTLILLILFDFIIGVKIKDKKKRKHTILIASLILISLNIIIYMGFNQIMILSSFLLINLIVGLVLKIK